MTFPRREQKLWEDRATALHTFGEAEKRGRHEAELKDLYYSFHIQKVLKNWFLLRLELQSRNTQTTPNICTFKYIFFILNSKV